MLLKLARLICANRVELVSCNMFVSYKALCKNKDKICMRNKDNCATAKYYNVGLDNNFQWTIDVKWHFTSEVELVGPTQRVIWNLHSKDQIVAHWLEW